MDIGVEISLYPLKADYLAAIHEFLGRLGADQRLRVVTNSMSTQVFGEFGPVMDTLRAALGASFASVAGGAERQAFVLKIFGPLTPA